MTSVARLLAAIAVLAAAVAPLAVHPGRAQACSCAVERSPTNLEFVDTVFSGTVRAVGEWDQRYSSSYPVKIEVDADTVWLGIANRDTVIRTAALEASCGYTFEEGVRYLIYATGDEVSYCSPTQPYSAGAVAELEALVGPGRPVDQTGDPRQAEPTENDANTGLQADWKVAIVALGSLVAAAAVLFVARRR